MVGLKKSKYGLPAGLAARPKRRPARVADLLHNEIASLFLLKVNDPRLNSVTITKVVVSDDLRQARVYFTCPASELKNAVTGLESVKGFVRNYLAQELQMRYVPDLIFKSDPAAYQAERMDQLFKEIEEEHHESE